VLDALQPSMSTLSQGLYATKHIASFMTSSYNHDIIVQNRFCRTLFLGHRSRHGSSGPRVHCLLFQLLASTTSMHVDGRLLQAHRKLQELGDLRGIDYLQSGNLYPEIGPDLAGLSALKLRVDEVGPS